MNRKQVAACFLSGETKDNLGIHRATSRVPLHLSVIYQQLQQKNNSLSNAKPYFDCASRSCHPGVRCFVAENPSFCSYPRHLIGLIHSGHEDAAMLLKIQQRFNTVTSTKSCISLSSLTFLYIFLAMYAIAHSVLGRVKSEGVTNIFISNIKACAEGKYYQLFPQLNSLKSYFSCVVSCN